MKIPRFRYILPLAFVALALTIIGHKRESKETNNSFRLIVDISAYNKTMPAWTGLPMSGTFGLTWSPDGEKLAIYTRYGNTVDIWDRDGTFDREIERACPSLNICSTTLAFINGHKQLVMGASQLGVWETINVEQKQIVSDSALSVYDMHDKKLTVQVKGNHIGQDFVANAASVFVVSPDGLSIASTYHAPDETYVGIYSTKSWTRTAFFRVGRDVSYAVGPLAYSQDGSILAVVSYDTLFMYSTRDWHQIASLHPFHTKSNVTEGIGNLAFSGDGRFLAIGSSNGGTFWVGDDGHFEPDGVGKRVEQEPRDPIHVFELPDLKLRYSISGFGNAFGFLHESMSWLPSEDRLAFLSAYGRLYIWDPVSNALEMTSTHIFKPWQSVVTTPQTPREVAVNYSGGIKVFEVSRNK